MMTKRLYIFIALLLLCLQFSPVNSFAQLKQYQFEQIDSLQNISKKPVAVFIKTQWCRYCHAMQQTSLKDRTVISSLNKNYYFISFDAEQEQDINFNNKIFSFIPTGNKTGVQQLAEQLGTIDGELSYPTLCILDPNNRILLRRSGFLTQNELILILRKLE